MPSFLLYIKCANSLLSRLENRGEATVEFESTSLAQRTVSRLATVAPFCFRVFETPEGFLHFEKLEVIF